MSLEQFRQSQLTTSSENINVNLDNALKKLTDCPCKDIFSIFSGSVNGLENRLARRILLSEDFQPFPRTKTGGG